MARSRIPKLSEPSRPIDPFEDQAIRGLSHELRTPLNAILGFTDVLLNEIDGNLEKAQREDLKIVRSAGHRANELLDGILQQLVADGASMDPEATHRRAAALASALNHDLRSPLNAIIGFAEVLAEGGDGSLNPEQRRSVDIIYESACDLLRMTAEIVDSSRLRSGRLVLRKEWMPVAALATAAVGRAKTFAKRSASEFVTDFEPGLPAVYVDPKQLRQALVGALVQYLRHVEDGSQIRLRTYAVTGPHPKEPNIRFELVPGSRLRPESASRMADYFEEGDAPIRRIDGLTLSMSFLRAVVRAHEGRIGILGDRLWVILSTSGKPA